MKLDANGFMKGSTGNVTYYNYRGQQRARVKHPLSHHDAETPKQKNQRHKMTMANGYLCHIKPFIKEYYKIVPPYDAYNAAKRHIINDAHVTLSGTTALDYSKILVCQGTLAPPDSAMMHFNPFEQTFTFTWADNSEQARANADDQLVFLIYDNFNNSYYSSLHMGTTATRVDRAFCFKAEHMSPGNYMVYMAFRKNDSTDVSNSVCVGMVSV